MIRFKTPVPLLLALACCGPARAQPLVNERYRIEPVADGAVRITAEGAGTWTFRGDFVVLVASRDPQPAMRPANIPHVTYNVVTWRAPGPAGAAALRPQERSAAQAGDGFDDRITGGDTRQRTPDLFAAASPTRLTATGATPDGDGIRFSYPSAAGFEFTARLTLPPGDAEPVLAFTLGPKQSAWFSVGYVGAPSHPLAALEEVWQPFIWQEKRFPAVSYLTPAFECPLPAAMIRKGGASLGVLADAAEYPFQPLPLLENSRFGVALRNPGGEAQSMVFAPMLGGPESKRAAGESFTFKLRLFVGASDIPTACEALARRLYGFRDFRRNAIASLNETLDNMIDYGLSRYSWFVDELKGCAYATDVPGAVKNVSSLNPLSVALVTDDEEIFRRRAYPILEYMLSREKFLFSLDPKQKIQSPSRALKGPCAPVSELAALHGITHGASPVLRQLAQQMLGRNRTLNLDDVAEGASWPNQLAMFDATGQPRFLEAARRGADAYATERIDRPATGFDGGGCFFWTGFAPKWIDLFRLYESTGERRYLEAARKGAREYTLFTWMSPRVPDEDITVNAGGNAPVYWYLKSKGHRPMHSPEERVPAWRLSEIGLTPESSGTMAGHRAIFMANFAPWMLRIAAAAGDPWLHDVARSAVVGRYRNFPGYHINTARTTIYEKADYPLHEHLELSVNSFHYNHIWPHLSLLLDFLVSDAFGRSHGAIDFPSRFIEGYAYLQSKFYGDRPGKFYGHDDAVLWMPRRLMQGGSVELNHLAARGRSSLYVAWTNQSPNPVTTEVTFNAAVLPQVARNSYPVKVLGREESRWVNGRADLPSGSPRERRDGEMTELRDGRMTVTVSPLGLMAIEVQGLTVTPKFQDRLMGAKASEAWQVDYLELPFGHGRAMILNFGPAATTAYVYLQDDDSRFKEVTLIHGAADKRERLTDAAYPFEFTVPLGSDATEFSFQIEGTTLDGRTARSDPATLRK